MKKKNDKRVYLDDYISVAKYDAIIRIIFTIIVILFILLTKLYIDEIFKSFVIFIFIFVDSWFIRVYIILLQIKKQLIKAKKYDNIFKIDFWNEYDTLFIDKYIVIFHKFKVNIIKYDDLIKIKTAIHYFARGTGIDLILTLKNKTTYKFLIEWGAFCNFDYKKVINFIGKKNKKIVIEDSTLQNRWHRL